MKSLLFWILCLFLSGLCGAQNSSTNKSVKTPPAGATNASQNLSSVLFATNEDCDLYINDELKGEVRKTAFTYLKLPAGKYGYKAITKTTGDELTDTFTVSEGSTNEVFMDLLLVVDEKNEQRARLTPKTTNPVQSLVRNDEKPEAFKFSDSVDIQNKDAITAVINFFLGNMVLMKGGKFTMGNSRSPFPDEAEHTVTINPVYFSKYEVTQHQWQTIMGYNPSLYKNCPTCPVENVSWEEVMKFMRKLNAISGKNFRLPTEAEWEYAAKLGGKDEIENAGSPEEYVRKTAWYFQNATSKTHPVGTKEPNVAGIFDLMGNVSEWCSDWYGAFFYREDFRESTPQGPRTGKEKNFRGGNFKDSSGDRFRPSLRNKKDPLHKSGEIGFRLVLDVGY